MALGDLAPLFDSKDMPYAAVDEDAALASHPSSMPACACVVEAVTQMLLACSRYTNNAYRTGAQVHNEYH